MKATADGYSMIEVVISILLTAVMVSAVFSVALTARQGGGKADRKLMASQASKALASVLKSYVTADPTNTVIQGPNSYNTINRWSINMPGIQEDNNCNLTWTGTDVTNASAGLAHPNIYALTPNSTHCLICDETSAQSSLCFLPKAMRDPPISAWLYYTVDNLNPPQARVGVWWTEP